MAETKKVIGRLPVQKGEYIPGSTYQKLNEVTMYGSTFRSLADNNTTAPATLDDDGLPVFNTDKWIVIAKGVSLAKDKGNSENAAMTQKAVTEAIASETIERIKAMTEVNISVLCPTSGYKTDGSLGGDLYDLTLAITTYQNWLLAQVGSSQIEVGKVLGFKDKDNSGVNSSWEFLGGNDNTAIVNWRKTGEFVVNINTMNITKSIDTQYDGRYIIKHPLKKGNSLIFKVDNLKWEGSGEKNINIIDIDSRLLLGTLYDNGLLTITLENDVNRFEIRYGKDSTIISGSADVTLLYGSAADNYIESIEQRNKNKIIEDNISDIDDFTRNVGSISTRFTLSTADVDRKVIEYDFKEGEQLVLNVSEFIIEGTGACNINARDVDNSKYLVIMYDKKGYIYATLTEDTTNIIISIGKSATITSAIANCNILYGSAATAFINKEQQDIKNAKMVQSVADIDAKFSPFINSSAFNLTKNGTLTDFIYANKVWVGYQRGFDNDTVITEFRIDIYQASSAIIGKVYNLCIGEIDQRNWLLPRISFQASVTSVTGRTIVFDLSSQQHIAMAGEVFFIELEALAAGATCGLSTDTYDEQNKLMRTTDIKNALIANSTSGCSGYSLSGFRYDSVFTDKSTTKALDNKIQSIESKMNNINRYTDSVTGKIYEITIVNGSIFLQSMQVDRLLVIGHSFVMYNNSPGADWYLDDGENRAMAASVNNNQWAKLLAEQCGNAKLSIKSGVDFERNYAVDYDFANKWNITDDYDAICIYLNENAVYTDAMQASWEAMLRYLKSAAPSSKIYCTGSWISSNKQQSIASACANVPNINYVDCVGIYSSEVNKSTRWLKGDYYYGRWNTYYPMGAPSSHPNDKGMLDIANKFLLAMSQGQITDIVHTITLNQSIGGTIETPNIIWLENGVVTIRCNPDAGYAISSMSVVGTDGAIEVVKRTNNYFDNVNNKDYYTFIMPCGDVSVTPTWITV